MLRKITITGTRSTDHRDRAQYEELFATYLAPFTEPGRRFYVSAARGIDSLVLTWLAERTSCPLIVAVPGHLTDEPADVQLAASSARDAGRVDTLVELATPVLTADAYRARNRWMVDRSDFVIGFPLGREDRRSGTWYTLSYAALEGKPRLVVPV